MGYMNLWNQKESFSALLNSLGIVCVVLFFILFNKTQQKNHIILIWASCPLPFIW